ncbi:MAG: CPBP family intramembrane metalloprotease [bacterium]|nr:CPBP family intramembrane metalloprotease [bacterium]
MNNLKMRWEELKTHLTAMPPVIAASLLLILIAIPIDVLSKIFGLQNKAEIQAMEDTLKNTPIKELVYQFLILAPLTQEFFYRGPVRLLIFFFPNLNTKNLITWVVILLPTYYWAVLDSGGHGFPLDALFMGMVAGWAVVETKSLESAIFLHIAYNSLGLIGALIKYRFL